MGIQFSQFSDPIPPIGKKGYFLVEIDVTKGMVDHDFDPDKLLTGEMTNKTKCFANKHWDLPKPVVTINPPYRPYRHMAKVFLHPNEDRSRYADLLDDFIEVYSQEHFKEYYEEDSEEDSEECSEEYSEEYYEEYSEEYSKILRWIFRRILRRIFRRIFR